MGRDMKLATTLVVESPREFFVDQVEQALERLKFQPHPLSRHYLVELLQHYMFASNLFPIEDETGRLRRDTLAEMYLKALNSPGTVRIDLLKKLGDSSLYISGFFGDSLSRKIVDIDYYVDMGGVAYNALSTQSPDEQWAQVYAEFSRDFAAFVDVLTCISQESRIQSNHDILKLFDRYMATGSRLAEEQLLEKGLLNSELGKAKANKM